MAGVSLLDHVSALTDPRQPGKVLYPLPEVMLLVLCATLAGAEDFVEILSMLSPISSKVLAENSPLRLVATLRR